MPNDRPDFQGGAAYVTEIWPSSHMASAADNFSLGVSTYASVQLSIVADGANFSVWLQFVDINGTLISQLTCTGAGFGTTYDIPNNAATINVQWVTGSGTVTLKGSGIFLDKPRVYYGDYSLGDLGIPYQATTGNFTSVAGTAHLINSFLTGGLSTIAWQFVTAGAGYLQLQYPASGGTKAINVANSTEAAALTGSAPASSLLTKLIVLPYGLCNAYWVPSAAVANIFCLLSIMRES